jgi:hypothetical protein
MGPMQWWRARRAQRAADLARIEEILRDLAEDEPSLFDTRDPVEVAFAEARGVLVGMLPAAPLSPPAALAWREIEADLASDPELMLPVLDAVREHPTT